MSNKHHGYKGTTWEHKETKELFTILEDNDTFVMIESEKCEKTITVTELLGEYWLTNTLNT